MPGGAALWPPAPKRGCNPAPIYLNTSSEESVGGSYATPNGIASALQPERIQSDLNCWQPD